jgi:hypothetical protein
MVYRNCENHRCGQGNRIGFLGQLRTIAPLMIACFIYSAAMLRKMLKSFCGQLSSSTESVRAVNAPEAKGPPADFRPNSAEFVTTGGRFSASTLFATAFSACVIRFCRSHNGAGSSRRSNADVGASRHATVQTQSHYRLRYLRSPIHGMLVPTGFRSGARL